MNFGVLLPVLVRFAVTFAVGLMSIWLSLGQMAAEKIATALALPAGLLWLFLLFSASYAVAARQRESSFCLLLAWLLLTIGGNGYLAGQLSAAIEQPYLQTDPLREAPLDVVVVLGGGGASAANGRLQGNTSGDLLILAAQLYHQGIARSFVCTGQRIESMDASGTDPATISATVLKQLGVDAGAIEMLGGRNTAEEMQLLGERFRDSKQRVGVVTSAWHLPRALALADRHGFHPVPLPADFRTGPLDVSATSAQVIEAMIPSGVALATNSALLKEYLGMALGR